MSSNHTVDDDDQSPSPHTNDLNPDPDPDQAHSPPPSPSPTHSTSPSTSPSPSPRPPTDPAPIDPTPTTNNPPDPSPDPLSPPPAFDWPSLETAFLAEMTKCQAAEKALGAEFQEWLAVFHSWTRTTVVHESERAHKRLRTRMAWVQCAEEALAEKRAHYVKVVKAFESAIALLGGEEGGMGEGEG